MGDEFVDEYRELREATARDHTRSRKEPKWSPPEVIATWPCRNQKCGKPVGLTEGGGDMFALFNRVLRERGEPAMESNRVLICDDCRRLAIHDREQKSRQCRADTAAAIRTLKAHPDPEKATVILAELDRLGHTDVKGLVEALKSKKGRRVSKEDV